MNDKKKDGRVTIHRLVDSRRELVLAWGCFSELFQAYRTHVERWAGLPDSRSLVMVCQGLAATTLHLSCRPEDESVAWTLNIKKPPLNIFLVGDNLEFITTGRIYTQGVKTTESSRLFVEAQRPRQKPYQSMVEVTGLDVLDIFEQYYAKSEQNQARFMKLDREDFLMIQGLPQANWKWIRSLSIENAKIWLEEGLRDIGARLYRFQCGCNPQKILEVVRRIY